MGKMFDVVFIVPDTSDLEVEEVYDWMGRLLRENSGPGCDREGGPTWTLRDFLRAVRDESPRVFGELLREANS